MRSCASGVARLKSVPAIYACTDLCCALVHVLWMCNAGRAGAHPYHAGAGSAPYHAGRAGERIPTPAVEYFLQLTESS
jgi:hypothetical protein